MADYNPAARADQVPNGAMKAVLVNGHAVLLARVQDELYAVSNRCTHMGGDLSRGTLGGTVVTCPRHGSRFDVRDGHVVRWLKGEGLLSRLGAMLKPPRPVRTYKVKTERGDILVQAE